MKFGRSSDIEAINEAVCSGVKLLFTIHGNSIEDISNKLDITLFETIVVLTRINKPGEIKQIYKLKGDKHVCCC